MPDPIMILDGSDPTAPPEIRPATPEEQAAIDAVSADVAARIVYAGVRMISAPPMRTTDDQPHEVFRFSTHAQHVYRTTVRVSAIDAGNGTTRDSEVRMVFKGLAASIVQVGTTVVMSNMQDTAAAGWRIQPVPQGTDLVIQVTGAAGRSIDWQVTGDVGTFAPAGLEA